MQKIRWWDVARRSRDTSALRSERDRLTQELKLAQEQIATLTANASAGAERDRLARNVQDTVAQELTSLVLTVQRGRRELRSGNAPGAAKQFNILEENVRRVLKEARALAASNLPVGIEGGLTIALDELGEAFERDTGVSVTVRAPGTGSLEPDIETILLGSAHTALANIRAHSAASAASITVSATHGTVVLRVADNGVGFDTAVLEPGGGITGHALGALRSRIELADGSLTVISTPGNGTAVIASLPGTGPGAL